MKPSNFTEMAQDRKAEGFSLRVRTNKVKPNDDSKPLTIAEYSLTNEVRDRLKAALDAREKESDASKKESLGSIISRLLPEAVLADLHMFAQTKGSKTVYVMHNLPEITDKEALAVAEMNMQGAYCRRIQQGVAEAIGLKAFDCFEIIRRANEDSTTGETLHKHDSDVDMLSVPLSNGAATRFTDFKALLEATVAYPMLQPFQKTHDAQGTPIENKMRNSDYDFLGSKQERIVHPPIGKEKKWERLVKEYSQEVVLGKGSMAIWANDGHLLHQAMKTSTPDTNDTSIIRIALGSGCNRA